MAVFVVVCLLLSVGAIEVLRLISLHKVNRLYKQAVQEYQDLQQEMNTLSLQLEDYRTRLSKYEEITAKYKVPPDFLEDDGSTS